MTSLKNYTPAIRWLRCAHGTIVLLTVAALGGCGGKSTPPSDAAKTGEQASSESAVVVRAKPAEFRTIEITTEGFGRCDTLPQKVASLAPALEGQVEKMLAKPGEAVKKAQPIVQLDQRIARANLAEKMANRDALKASLRLLEAPPRPEELKAQQAAVDQAKVVCEKAQANVERLRPLLAKGEIPGAQLSDAESAARQSMLQCDAARAQLDAMKLGPRPEAVTEAKARIETADAQVESAQAQLDLLTLRAPIDGVLDSLTCQLGQTVSVGAAIGEIVDAHQLQVTVWLPANTSARVHVGQNVRIWSDEVLLNKASGETFSGAATKPATDQAASKDTASSPKTSLSAADDRREAAGKVASVGQVVDPQTGNLPVQIVIDNPNGRFAVGQTVSVAITVDEKKGVLAVPVAAIFDVGQGSAVSVVRDGKSVRTQTVLGARDKSWVELLTADLKPPLHAGESVIVDGGYNLPDGTEVRINGDLEKAPAEHPAQESPTDAKTASNSSASRGALP